MLLTHDEIKDYLDDAIRHWRKKRDNAITDEDKLMAVCYVDAFQSVRVSVFGKLLPLEEGDA